MLCEKLVLSMVEGLIPQSEASVGSNLVLKARLLVMWNADPAERSECGTNIYVKI